jgi:hypothetical protein
VSVSPILKSVSSPKYPSPNHVHGSKEKAAEERSAFFERPCGGQVWNRNFWVAHSQSGRDRWNDSSAEAKVRRHRHDEMEEIAHLRAQVDMELIPIWSIASGPHHRVRGLRDSPTQIDKETLEDIEISFSLDQHLVTDQFSQFLSNCCLSYLIMSAADHHDSKDKERFLLP